MDDLQIDSQAFREALLASKRRRIYGVVAFRLRHRYRSQNRNLWLAYESMGSDVSVAVVAYELWTLHEVGKALQTSRDVPGWLLWCNILAEVIVPVLGVAYFSSPLLAIAYRAVATPWVLALFPLIMLSILRLNPLVSGVGLCDCMRISR